MIYFEVRDKNNGKIIIENISRFDCPLCLKENKNQTLRKEGIKSRYEEYGLFSLWFVADRDSDLLRSNSLFNKTMKMYANLAEIFWAYYIEKLKMQSHTLRTIHGQMKQKIEGVAEKKNFRGIDYAESKLKISHIISEDISGTADTLCYLNKRVSNLEAHIEGVDLMCFSDILSYNVPFKKVNVKKVLLNILSPFLKDLNDKKIFLNICIDDQYAESNKISLNYKFLNLALYNFFDNVIKYAKNDSYVKVIFQSKNKGEFEIDFEMISCKIDKDELDKIFDCGYSGRHACGSGDGIGMFYVKNFLKITKMDIFVTPVYSETEEISEITYTKNIFKIFNC